MTMPSRKRSLSQKSNLSATGDDKKRKSEDHDANTRPQCSLSQTAIDIIDSVAAGNISGINDCDNVDEISSLKDEIKVLKSIVFRQEQSIAVLTSKMNQLLQVIGINDTVADVDKNVVSPVDVDAQSLSDQPVAGPTFNANSNKNSTKERLTIARSFSQAVLKTVAIEHKRQTIRKRNIVISGLPPSVSRPDTRDGTEPVPRSGSERNSLVPTSSGSAGTMTAGTGTAKTSKKRMTARTQSTETKYY